MIINNTYGKKIIGLFTHDTESVLKSLSKRLKRHSAKRGREGATHTNKSRLSRLMYGIEISMSECGKCERVSCFITVHGIALLLICRTKSIPSRKV